jgi:sugar O-acyltransferase (sialic acid O-acetyltransferase NeuD family)
VNRIAIIGAGDLGIQLAHLGRTAGFEISGYFDDTREHGERIGGAIVLGGLADIAGAFARSLFDALVVGIGYRHLALRRELYLTHAGRIPFATLIHPSATIDPGCIIEEGAVIYPGCILDMDARIGANVLLNAGCVIAHHSEIGTGCFLSPAVSIAGFVVVEQGCVLGIGTIVIDNIRISAGCRTGAGAVVTQDLQQRGLYLGIPARFAKALP